MAEMQKIVRSDRVGERAPVAARLGVTAVVVVRYRGVVRTFRNTCPHAGAPLSGGTRDGAWLRCPRHGWEFDVQTGACPAHPLYQLKGFETEERDGWVWARADETEIW